MRETVRQGSSAQRMFECPLFTPNIDLARRAGGVSGRPLLDAQRRCCPPGPAPRLMKTWLEEGRARNEPQRVPKPVRLRLTVEQLARLRQAGLDIHLEAS